MAITVAEPRVPAPLVASPPGYGRAYASVPVQISVHGALRPAAFAQWLPFVPGSSTQYTGPLFGSPDGVTPLLFPQTADDRGVIQVWAPEPVRIEVGAWLPGYPMVRQVLDLLFTEDFTKESADGLYAPLSHTTLADQHPEYLTEGEGDLRYLPLDYVPPPSGITQDDADLRYVNTAGDTMTGALAFTRPSFTDPILVSRVGAQAQPQFSALAGGYLSWGPGGSTAPDTFLERLGARTLALEGHLRPKSNLNFDLGLTNVRWRKVWAVDAEFTNPPTVGGLPITGGGITQADADLRYVNVAGDVMSGILTVPQLNLNIPSTGPLYGPVWKTADANRWFFGMLGTETGGNAGANLELHRASDAGADLGTALTLSRATGAATFGGELTAGQLWSTGPLAALRTADRAYPGVQPTWQIYAYDGVLYLHAPGVGDAMSVSKTGTATFAGPVTVNGILDASGHIVSVGGNFFSQGRPIVVSPTAGNSLTWDATGLFVPAGGGGGLDVATGDARYVNVSGDTMTGRLVGNAAFGLLELGATANGTDLYVGATRHYLLRESGFWPEPDGGKTLGMASGRWGFVYGLHADFSGDVAAGSLSAPLIVVNRAAATNRVLDFRSAGSSRWSVWTDNTAETGSNAGSDFRISRYSDAGAYVGDALKFARATGEATFSSRIVANGGMITGGDVEFYAGVYVRAGFTSTGTGTATFAGPVTTPVLHAPTVQADNTSLILRSTGGNWVLADGVMLAPAGTGATMQLGDAGTSHRWGAYYGTTIDATGAATFGGAVTANSTLSVLGGLFNKDFAVWHGTNPYLAIDAASGQTGRLVFRHPSAANRWVIEKSGAPETGSNAGSDFSISRWDDAGGNLGTALSISRATGAATFGGIVAFGNGAGTLEATGAHAQVTAPGGDLILHANSQAVVPAVDAFVNLGKSGTRWATVYASTGTINTSSRKYKDPAGDLDPDVALAAVVRTPARRFRYKGTDRLQSGYYMEEADPLFTIGPEEASATNDAGILLAAIQALVKRVRYLEERIA